MRILLILTTLVVIDCSVGAPPAGCESGIDKYKQLVKAKADLKSSLVAALLGKNPKNTIIWLKEISCFELICEVNILAKIFR